MAVAPAKAKAACKAPPKPNAGPKKMQMHRRSRTGCYICRLRRKKCDEGTPSCTACKHLGLRCEYKRPMWWSNNDQRRVQKDQIKMIIKRKKLSEKTANVMTPAGTPPGLSHSLPTSATYSDPLSRPRSASMESHYGMEFDFSAPTAMHYSPYTGAINYAPVYPEFAPYDIDVKTERQMFVNDIPTRRESTVSTFSSFRPANEPMLPYLPLEREWAEDMYGNRLEPMSDDSLGMEFFDFAHTAINSPRQLSLDLDAGDRRLLDHFIAEILPTIFPILELNRQGSVRSDLVLPALETNKCYLHCCLSMAAQHLKLRGMQSEQIDNDILRHRYATVSELCSALNQDEDHQQILEAALGMAFFQCSVGRVDDSLPDIAWHQHFQAAVNIAMKLGLPRTVTEMTTLPDGSFPQTPFNMSLTAWIDILGATMLGRSPVLAATYREKHLTVAPGSSSLGLRELMGCDDRVMYLISEIACLEALKRDGMDDIQLCQHVHSLGDQIGLTELQDGGAAAAPKIPFNANGVLNPRQLSRNITAAFRLAARIYLCSLVPGFSPSQGSCIGLVEKLASVLEFIPSGPGGYDRSLVWVYLIGGSMALPNSSFRRLFQERAMGLGELADVGSFGRVACLLHEVWALMDTQVRGSPRGSEGQAEHEVQLISWRDVMQSKGWDFLLI